MLQIVQNTASISSNAIRVNIDVKSENDMGDKVIMVMHLPKIPTIRWVGVKIKPTTLKVTSTFLKSLVALELGITGASVGAVRFCSSV